LDFVDDATIAVLELADLARRGTWPMSGGSLDQTAWFISFCRCAWSCREEMMSKHGLRELNV